MSNLTIKSKLVNCMESRKVTHSNEFLTMCSYLLPASHCDKTSARCLISPYIGATMVITMGLKGRGSHKAGQLERLHKVPRFESPPQCVCVCEREPVQPQSTSDFFLCHAEICSGLEQLSVVILCLPSPEKKTQRR